MTLKIRTIQQADHRRVEEITREAFWNLYVPGSNEHFIVYNMWTTSDYISQLSLVIELDQEIIGSILYTQSKIVTENGKKSYEMITFGPVSILPEFQGMGYGKKLIAYSIDRARELGYRGILIGGYPHYYAQFGFSSSKKYQLSLPDKNYYTGILALPLIEGGLDNMTGSIFFSEVLEPDDSQLEQFDQTFPTKLKQVQASQKEFEKAVSQLETKNY
ncbi:GNAT family N-acetyltransferase [Carnobacterium gallinarum]|uniref:GNAT family N-acetyltransferase n=1 Tax=Carnobacterium gallinarum TaxID=2749 RepID=UPI00054F95F8|nr:N-acetyltransferase [Carnobacterium gallinarum]